ncbi:hypothetical protein CSC2_31460 [Clostridium zeae]|uniref:Uncharacterized protein n=1 Tax=Clostridium zeae TaxID=2759022 RepID=A0ABQ1ECU1_9CLOT|nr:hypothetical protein CSC2_31460 [Clostridium zeae]
MSGCLFITLGFTKNINPNKIISVIPIIDSFNDLPLYDRIIAILLFKFILLDVKAVELITLDGFENKAAAVIIVLP